MSKKVGVISLGCDKNRVDTETMLYNLQNGGFLITADFDEAQILIVNTCAFIQSARSEAIDTILAAAEYKKRACEKLIVTGCLPQKYGEELRASLPEVDAFLGTNEYASIVKVIHTLYRTESADSETIAEKKGRFVSTPAHYAYLRIADGCDNYCTFCTIPSIRGKYRSVPQEELLEEARFLVDEGARELILIAQDVTRYGIDLYGSSKLVPLLQALSALDVDWIRLLYCYPECVDDELIHEIDSNPKIAKYIDIPLQHVDSNVLKRMNRRSTYESICTLFRKLRAAKNHIAIRTTFMVGFPGETEEQFARLKDFIREYAPDHIGVFAYSKEEDTPSAKLKGHLRKSIKQERVNEVGKLHYENCLRHNRAAVGKTFRVLYEDIDYERGLFKGRTQYNAPEIDTDVYFAADYVEVGNFYEITITDTDGYDLVGELANHEFTD